MSAKKEVLEIHDDKNGVVMCSRSYLALPQLHIIPLLKSASFEIATTNTDKTFISSKSVSSYPMVEDKQTHKMIRDGDPNADGFYAAVYDNRSILAIADGCNWGIRSFTAARRAIEGVSKYLLSHEDEMADLRHAGHLLLRAFCEANKKIMEGVTESWEAGTTTMLVGVVMQVTKEPGLAPEWGFLCCSVGDCKAYLWNKHSNAFTDVTLGNRCADMRDPGGRLGPYIGKDPDLRNLRLHYRTLQPGDIIVLCSDGVYDNFDPIFLGLSPKDLGLNYDNWNGVPDDIQEKVKEQHSLKFAQSLVLKQCPNGVDVTPGKIVDAFVGHALELTSHTRKWMEANPGKKQPSDYHSFPGKMDHTTALAFIVGQSIPPSDITTPAPSTTTTTTNSIEAATSSMSSNNPPPTEKEKKPVS